MNTEQNEPARGEAAGGTGPESRSPNRTDVEQALLGGTTYRSLGEQRLSATEERFEKNRRTTGLWLAPLLAIAFLALPLDLPAAQHTLAGILLGVIVLWVTEAVPIPIGGLIGVGAIVLMGVVPADDALAPLGSATIFTFIGAFILAQAMLKHGVARRFAFFILSLPGIGNSTARLIVAFGLVTALLSAFISNTATVAMLLPTAIGLLTVIAKMLQDRGLVAEDFDPTRLRVGTAIVLMLAFGASVGGLLTPVGSPPNLIGRGLIEDATGRNISFAAWMGAAIPICAAMFVLLAIVLLLLNKPEIRRIEGVEEYVASERERMGSWSRAELNTVIAFVVTVVLWITPGVIALLAGADSAVYETVGDRLDEGVVAVLGASLLFLLPVDWRRRETTLNWSDATRIDWGTILLFGTGIIFGTLLADTGLAKTLGTSAYGFLGLTSTFAITAFAVVLAIVVSETTSNTASAAVVVPIILPIAAAAGIDPMVPGLAATFAASFGFMLPVSTPQNAVAYGSGLVPITKMIRSGISFDVAGAILILIVLPLMIAAIGLGA
ncbi:MAG: DASS family sodium-coupled anion symporter [Streptosporangiales bacterium]|nr:DASS family sodium-coupled anion symporter [Streptosporangiales bacterium]